jgi:hypothetical protein
VLKKKKKEKTSSNTALPPTRRQKPTHKSPTAAGMRQCKRSVQAKKNRSSIEQKEENHKIISFLQLLTY